MDTFKVPSPDLMTCLEHFIINPNVVYRYLPKIISYLPLVESSTWNHHITMFVVINAGKVVYLIFQISGNINSLHLPLHQRIFFIIVELHPPSNKILKFLHFSLTLMCLHTSIYNRVIIAIHILSEFIGINYIR